MAEFTIKDFTNSIRENIYNNFPYESDALKMIKHAKTPLHIRDIALGALSMENDMCVFEIGNDYAEEYYPYYHILEDAEVIRKKGKGTTKSRGSQALVQKLSDRDYARVSFNGKTYSREYQRNTRGKGNDISYRGTTRYYDGSSWKEGANVHSVKHAKRSLTDKATRIIIGADGKRYRVNGDANYYLNKHYHYIEKILDSTLPWIASEFGLRMGRTQITSLESDYEGQQFENTIQNIIGSFEED